VSRGVKKDVLPDLSLFSTVPRCLKRFKTPYIVDSGCPVSRAIADPFSPALCKAAIVFFSDRLLLESDFVWPYRLISIRPVNQSFFYDLQKQTTKT
jgi:hypothetical protein